MDKVSGFGPDCILRWVDKKGNVVDGLPQRGASYTVHVRFPFRGEKNEQKWILTGNLPWSGAGDSNDREPHVTLCSLETSVTTDCWCSQQGGAEVAPNAVVQVTVLQTAFHSHISTLFPPKSGEDCLYEEYYPSWYDRESYRTESLVR